MRQNRALIGGFEDSQTHPQRVAARGADLLHTAAQPAQGSRGAGAASDLQGKESSHRRNVVLIQPGSELPQYLRCGPVDPSRPGDEFRCAGNSDQAPHAPRVAGGNGQAHLRTQRPAAPPGTVWRHRGDCVCPGVQTLAHRLSCVAAVARQVHQRDSVRHCKAFGQLAPDPQSASPSHVP